MSTWGQPMATDLDLRFSRTHGAFESQREAVRAVLSGDYEAVGFIGGFGSGKTRTAAVLAIALAGANPGLPGMVVSPTYGMLLDTVFPTIIEVLEENGIPYVYRVGSGRPKIVLPWGSEIWGRSAEKPEKLKGPNLAWVIFDEAGIMKAAAWTEGTARVRHPKARLLARVVTTTPEGLNWVYDTFGTGRAGHLMVNAPTTQNKALAASYVEQLLDTMDEQHAKAYVEGRFVPLFQRLVYYNWSRDQHVRPVAYDADLPLFFSHDFNVHPMCSVVYQMPTPRDIHVIDEIVLPNSNTPEVAQEFLERFGDHRGRLTLQGDASARARDTRQESARSDFDILEDILDHGMRFAVVERDIGTSNPSLKRRFNTVNGLLKSAAGRVSVAVDPSCEGLIASFERTVRKENAQVVDKAVEWKWKRHTFVGVEHPTDAFGYAACRHFRDPRDIQHYTEAA